MGSRKLLLKQKEVAEAFASWRDAFGSFPISYISTIDNTVRTSVLYYLC